MANNAAICLVDKFFWIEEICVIYSAYLFCDTNQFRQPENIFQAARMVIKQNHTPHYVM
ncbi:hypothetical protein MIS46_04615 [Wielerella bovis]|uniref:hypothetical protein n=1 Tax=Wielerella bovis TaxID=2917790 RepID=UPI002018B800|nr:hypothetical protein [Wielerella bovis]ULJ63338.1 hypothetical protein MIS46_04615 [Wielerella bovis]